MTFDLDLDLDLGLTIRFLLGSVNAFRSSIKVFVCTELDMLQHFQCCIFILNELSNVYFNNNSLLVVIQYSYLL